MHEKTDYGNKTLTGKVTDVDGTKVTLQLGELNEPPSGGNGGQQTPPNGNPPEKPDGASNAELPSLPDSSGSQCDGQQIQSSGSPPEIPDGASSGQMPSGDMPEPFTAGDETATFDLCDAEINVESGEDTKDGTIESISVGSILVIETDKKSRVKTVAVKMSAGGPGGNQDGSFGGSGQVTQGDAARLSQYNFWLAYYTDNIDRVSDVTFKCWQYTSSGKVDGISGRVDMSIYFP